MDKFLTASRKASEFLASQVDKTGKLKEEKVVNDLCSQYKLVTLLTISGHTDKAHVLLDRINRDFMQENGDFLSYPEKEGRDRKSENFPMSHYWTYMNSWIAMGAHRLGRFDVSYPAFQYCKQFYNPDHRMVCVTEEYSKITGDTTMDSLSTAHFGLLCLYMGDLELAKACGEGLLKFMEAQPTSDSHIYLRANAKSGAIITTPPENMAPFYVVKRDDPNQLYFFLGYHGIFMFKLFSATKDIRYLNSAKAILDFALTCHESMCVFSFSHKLAYAAALVAMETKEAKYRRLAIALGEYLMTIQEDSGLFCKDFGLVDKYDQSAEIAVWLRELSNELQKTG